MNVKLVNLNDVYRFPAERHPADIVGRAFFIVDHDGDVLDHLGPFEDLVVACKRGKRLCAVGGPNYVREFFVRRDGKPAGETQDSKDGLLSHPCV